MIEDILPRYQEVATGNKTAFTVPFETINSSYINVYLNKVKQTTGYTVSGKTITFGTAPASSTVVTIVRVIPISWEHTVLGAIDQNSLNKIFTEIIAKMQTLEEGLNRAIKTDVTDTESGSDYFLSLLADAMDSLAQAQTKLTQVQSAATQALSDISTAKTTAISDFNTNASTKTSDFNTNAAARQALVDAAAEAAEESAELAEQYAESINPENFDTVKGKISNCILEIPQDIKLEISSGNLVLKSGSKITTGNGTQYTTTSDFTQSVGTPTGQRMVLVTKAINSEDLGFLVGVNGVNIVSGATAPTVTAQTAYWYDTTNMVIKRTVDKGTTWNTIAGVDICLPIALVTYNAGTPVSIDQVFNGLGYIGSTVFALPGVKGLIPGGRNDDGTLKNIKLTLSNVIKAQVSGTYNLQYAITSSGIGVYYYSYDEEKNLNYRTDTGVFYYDRIICGNISTSSGKITSMEIPLPVRLATTEMLDNVQDQVDTKQDTLVSGTNIKTINSTSVLGSGDFTLANQSLSNLDSTGQMIVDSQNGSISNCILEIPQNIKCEINSGVLTLKSGSTYVNTGEVYSTTTTTSDGTIDISGYNDGTYVILPYGNGGLVRALIERSQSGSSLPETYYASANAFFLTTDKSIYSYSNGAWTKTPNGYPICIVIKDSNGVRFAKDSNGNDMIFNGAGFIGHHTFVYPNVKALLSNGLNEDKSLKSTSYTSNSLQIIELSANPVYVALRTSTLSQDIQSRYIVSKTEPINPVNNTVWYNPNTNLMKQKSSRGWVDVNKIYLIKCTYNGSIVTDFTIRQPYEGARNLLTDDLEKQVEQNTADIVNKQDKATAVNYDNITNCITEIPQDIKLELNNGTLTLKAGSKVYVPNGFNGTTPKFDVVTIKNDVTSSGVAFTGDCFYFVGNNALHVRAINQCSTFTTPPTQPISRIYEGYCSSDNKMYVFKNDTQTWVTSGKSFPICLVTLNSSTPYIRSLNQVFNGFGYIGSTVFALPNVKGLIPNGRNEDGTLKNNEFETTIVRTHTQSGQQNKANIYLSGSTVFSSDYRTYDEINNVILNSSGQKENICCIGSLTRESSSPYNITSFTPKTAFHAVDYNDFADLKDKVATKANDSEVAKIASNNTFTGTNTFVTPALSDDSQKPVTTEWFNNKIVLVNDLPASPNPDVWYATPEE